MGRTIAVTGAGGFVGSSIVEELLARGHRVRGLVRRVDGPMPASASDALTLVRGDLLDPAARTELLAGADACVNTVGILRETDQSFARVHVLAVRRLTGDMERLGVGRLVHISALGVGDEGCCAYQRTKFQGEQLIRAGSLDWTILRPSLIHGPGGGFMAMAKGWCTGRAFPHVCIPVIKRYVGGLPVPGLAKLEDPNLMPVAVEDVAWAVGEALDRDGAIGEVYNLVGPETVTMPQLLRAFQEALPLGKTELAIRGMPDRVGAAMATMADAVGLGGALPFDVGMALMAGRDSVACPIKAREHLGFAPRPCLETIAAYAPMM